MWELTILWTIAPSENPHYRVERHPTELDALASFTTWVLRAQHYRASKAALYDEDDMLAAWARQSYRHEGFSVKVSHTPTNVH